MIVRKARERGFFDHGWLRTFHTFSFADYRSVEHNGFRALRVINEDRVGPGMGFHEHPHRDMEIVTYVLKGALAHKDSLGNGSVIRPGDVQRMSAGAGVLHSEFNASASETVHFLQLWILPQAKGLPPSYEQQSFPAAERQGRLRLVASPDGRDGSVTVRQDVRIHAALLAPGERVQHVVAPGRHAWVQVARGQVDANGTRLEAGDGAAESTPGAIELVGRDAAELLLFDLG